MQVQVEVQKKTKPWNLWLTIPESGDGLPIALNRRGGAGWDGPSCGSNEELTSISSGPLDVVGCFCLCLSEGRLDHVDPGPLFVGLLSKSFKQRQIEEVLIKVLVWLFGSLVKSCKQWRVASASFCASLCDWPCQCHEDQPCRVSRPCDDVSADG